MRGSVNHASEQFSGMETQEDDQRLKTLSGRTVEHILALLPARIGNTPRDATVQPNSGPFELTGADVRMSAASTIANLSQSLTNRYHPSRHRIPYALLTPGDLVVCGVIYPPAK